MILKEKAKVFKHLQTEKEFEVFKKAGQTSMGFIFVFNDPMLSDPAKILFHYIYGDAARDGYSDLSNSFLTDAVGLNVSAVKSGIKALKLKGWFKAEMVITRTGSKRRLRINYNALRKAFPRKDQEREMGRFIGFAEEKKDKFNPNAISTYVVCNIHSQILMSIRPVLYDKGLAPLTRVLFQIISSLVRMKGYCFAQNTFFTTRIGVNQSTISSHLTLLEKKNILRITYGGSRKIFVEFDTLRKRYLKKPQIK